MNMFHKVSQVLHCLLLTQPEFFLVAALIVGDMKKDLRCVLLALWGRDHTRRKLACRSAAGLVHLVAYILMFYWNGH